MIWDFKDWYQRNKEEFNKKRRERYQRDKKYREKNRKRAKKYYKDKLKKANVTYAVVNDENKVTYYTIKKAAMITNVSESTLRDYHNNGILPPTIYSNERGWRLYSKKQLSALYFAFKELREKKIRSIHDIYDRLIKNWNKG